ncbi:Protein-L-isoaspartate O-methyltransferase [Sinosporangium album]|uniref:Protein-L-isoaspartate O-methyltransferase n=1 Tax=Sinosporangium album TaxID=504805 RepID=A0A1G8EQV3_9ACTN|nr:methyltransferase domain-containing protein [Sinosporangium album]SDH72283.1 Protein-L-isoaspartate O-methyltransferase [Sinosporangium album]
MAGVMEGVWREHARRLADELASAGALTDPVWREAFVNVPRHVFLPSFYLRTGDPADDPRTGRRCSPESAGYLTAVYSDETLVTQYIEWGGWPWATSSSTRPSLMVRMLDALGVADGAAVLEIGTGTGYNAALLSERLGDRHVTSVDIDPGLVEVAEARLASLGLRPALAVHDGREGWPGRAPYDRLIATVAFDHVPMAWLEQVRPGGVIVADLRPAGAAWAGGLATLTVGADGTASGRMSASGSGFMSARETAGVPGFPRVAAMDRSDARRRRSRVGGKALLDPGFALVVWRHLPDMVVYPGGDKVTLVAGPSWAENVTTGPAEVVFGGPRDVWAVVEDAYVWWEEQGRPGVGDFGLTVAPDRQWMWLRTPDGPVVE